MFADTNHLSTAGREIYTEQFARVLSRFLDSSVRPPLSPLTMVVWNHW